jgi:hypothetical protein
MLSKFVMLHLPVSGIRAYRLIPNRVRAIWSMGSSSSGKAIVMAYATGNGWLAISRYANPIKAPADHSWSD